MTYTAEDFKNARFATRDYRGRECRAVRLDPIDEGDVPEPWTLDCMTSHRSDEDMTTGGWVPVQESRPLTPDAIEVAIHDCMPKAALDRLSGTQVMRLAEDMHVALTEPPARPEGAEELETVIGLNAGKWTNGTEDVVALADLLASHGVRVVGSES